MNRECQISTSILPKVSSIGELSGDMYPLERLDDLPGQNWRHSNCFEKLLPEKKKKSPKANIRMWLLHKIVDFSVSVNIFIRYIRSILEQSLKFGKALSHQRNALKIILALT